MNDHRAFFLNRDGRDAFFFSTTQQTHDQQHNTTQDNTCTPQARAQAPSGTMRVTRRTNDCAKVQANSWLCVQREREPTERVNIVDVTGREKERDMTRE